MRLVHEIVADLESLQGASVEWDNVWPYSSGEFLIRICTADEKEFEIQVSVAEVNNH